MTRLLRNPLVWLPLCTILLGLVAWRSRVWEAPERLGAVEPLPLLAATALCALIAVLWALRSADLLAAAGRPVPAATLVPMTAFANTINNLTPGSVGELLRLYLLRAHHGVDYATGAAVVLIERVVAIGYLSGSALLLWLAVLDLVPLPAVVLGLVLLAGLPGLLYRMGLRPTAMLTELPLGGPLGPERWARWSAGLGRTDATIARLLGDPRRATVFAISTAAVLACYTAQLWLVAWAVGVTLDPIAAWAILGLGITAGVLSLLPFGLGATDVVIVGLLGTQGVPPLEAAAITFGYRLVSTLPLGVAGGLSYALLAASLPQSGTSGALQAARAGLAQADAPAAEAPAPSAADR
ncbi:MAG TPA: lysylphosphatidylglycerol synthase transmembrane domain-containing protein [Candidatus Limnocylindrales bacterium]|nr:lysylphosphatidylglycerol synthase transmembrane domain-containing protein [Candidatus Limnocylindrales bacterium]